MKLGIFDSGIGGQAIAQSLAKAFPDAELTIVDDRTHVPYGSRTLPEVRKLTNIAIQPLLSGQCDVIIIACNTASAAAIEMLRKNYPSQKFIGIEPMLKSAASKTKTGIITVCATPATLASPRYSTLVSQHAPHLTVIEPDCSDWAQLIEDNEINEQHIKDVLTVCLARGSDVIVLGCTHYHWIKKEIEILVKNNAVILEPSEAIAARVLQLLDA